MDICGNKKQYFKHLLVVFQRGQRLLHLYGIGLACRPSNNNLRSLKVVLGCAVRTPLDFFNWSRALGTLFEAG